MMSTDLIMFSLKQVLLSSTRIGEEATKTKEGQEINVMLLGFRVQRATIQTDSHKLCTV